MLHFFLSHLSQVACKTSRYYLKKRGRVRMWKAKIPIYWSKNLISNLFCVTLHFSNIFHASMSWRRRVKVTYTKLLSMFPLILFAHNKYQNNFMIEIADRESNLRWSMWWTHRKLNSVLALRDFLSSIKQN